MEGIPQNSFSNPKPVAMEKKARPQEQLNCPRCNSTNTKFCYYNNYSLTQPRYFCKTCRRYWTEGGSLRNIPVGGGSRKNKAKVTTSTSNSTSSPKILDLNPPLPGFSAVLESSPGLKDSSLNPNRSQINQNCTISIHQNPKLQGGGQDLNLAFPTSSLSAPHHHELLRSGMMDHSSGLNSTNIPYVPSLMMSGSYSNHLNYPSGFSMQEETKPSMMGFSVDGLGNRTYGVQESDNSGGRLLLPFGGVKQISSGTEVDQNNKEQGNSTGFWTGMIGEGSW